MDWYLERDRVSLHGVSLLGLLSMAETLELMEVGVHKDHLGYWLRVLMPMGLGTGSGSHSEPSWIRVALSTITQSPAESPHRGLFPTGTPEEPQALLS